MWDHSYGRHVECEYCGALNDSSVQSYTCDSCGWDGETTEAQRLAEENEE